MDSEQTDPQAALVAHAERQTRALESIDVLLRVLVILAGIWAVVWFINVVA